MSRYAVGWAIASILLASQSSWWMGGPTALLIAGAVAVALGSWFSARGLRERAWLVAAGWGVVTLAFLAVRSWLGGSVDSPDWTLPGATFNSVPKLPVTLSAFLIWPAFGFAAGAWDGAMRSVLPGRGLRILITGAAWSVGVSVGALVAYVLSAVTVVPIWVLPASIRPTAWFAVAAISGFAGGMVAAFLGTTGSINLSEPKRTTATA